jgi:hypothetical protein
MLAWKPNHATPVKTILVLPGRIFIMAIDFSDWVESWAKPTVTDSVNAITIKNVNFFIVDFLNDT